MAVVQYDGFGGLTGDVFDERGGLMEYPLIHQLQGTFKTSVVQPF